MRGTLRSVRDFYGAGPLHLLALIGCFALAGYAALRTLANPSWPVMLAWFGGAVIGHDLVAFPLYALADRSLTRALRALWPRRTATPPAGQVTVPVVNHIRVPALGAGLLFLLFFPGIVRQGAATYTYATGRTQQPYLGRWLILVAAMFAVSAVVYAVRTGHARHHASKTARGEWAAVAAWALLIAGVFAWGYVLRRAGRSPEDALPPLHATARLLTWQLLPAIGTAALLVVLLPVLARGLRWRPLAAAGWVAAAGWAVALAVSEGAAGLTGPITTPGEYYGGLSAMGGHPLRWLATFTEQAQRYPIHVKGHPPGPMLILWALDASGLHGPGWAAAVIIAVGGSASVAVAITVRALAGEELARRALPFLVLTPMAVWIATSMDALFMGAGAWATALLTLAATAPDPRRGRCLAGAVAAGLLFGSLPYLSYGLLPLFAVPLAVLIVARPGARVVAATLAAMTVVPLAFTLAGFWWPDGVAATHLAYLTTGGSSRRPYLFFLIGDFAVLGLLTGPAVAAGVPALARALRRGVGRSLPETERVRAVVALLAAAALLGTIVLDLAGLTRGEVERIWVPYAAWLTAATALRPAPGRRWLAAQAVTAIVVQALVHSPW
ncbi:hypothetical protein [Actinomadura sp. DC4]|uniref:hypothetical protein n=1 Tax=Actinomadura sp. DC4 TaxID=3055069 RepID=UPI0025B27EAB|nr:hypothetical protein [Actinomadura sp. DC4]MDN3358611.1 hypothetical protein [Actinomadura sp. DC4]